MLDLRTCTNDELVAEVERRLEGNTLGFTRHVLDEPDELARGTDDIDHGDGDVLS